MFIQCVFLTTFESIYSLKVKLQHNEGSWNEKERNLTVYHNRIFAAVLISISFDLAVVTAVEVIYFKEDYNHTPSEPILPPICETIL